MVANHEALKRALISFGRHCVRQTSAKRGRRDKPGFRLELRRWRLMLREGSGRLLGEAWADLNCLAPYLAVFLVCNYSGAPSQLRSSRFWALPWLLQFARVILAVVGCFKHLHAVQFGMLESRALQVWHVSSCSRVAQLPLPAHSLQHAKIQPP